MYKNLYQMQKKSFHFLYILDLFRKSHKISGQKKCIQAVFTALKCIKGSNLTLTVCKVKQSTSVILHMFALA